MQYKESYWEGMYWDGLDARDLGAHKVSSLLDLQPQLGIEKHILVKFIQAVKDEQGEEEVEHYWATIIPNVEDKQWIFHVWHEAVFYGSRALGIADPGKLCKTFILGQQGEIVSIQKMMG
jgi:hypothetical protein